MKVLAADSGGDVSCNAINQMTRPVFIEFNTNLTTALEHCLEKIDSFQQAHPSLGTIELDHDLEEMATNCSNQFVGILIEVVEKLDNLLSIVDSDDLLDVIAGGIKENSDPVLKCIAGDLTSVFPNITLADTEIKAKVNLPGSLISDPF